MDSIQILIKMNSIVKAHVGLNCPKCGGGMERGFVIDCSEISHVSSWISGAPQFGFLERVKDDNEKPIVTFRCSKCGYLESYTK